MKNQLQDFPLDIKISFHKIIEKYNEQVVNEQSSIAKEYMKNVLEYVASFPKLIEGIEDPEDLYKYKDAIHILLQDLFPDILSENEIKAASIPFHNLVFNSSKRFKAILANAGDDFELSMRNMDEDMYYIYGCILVLNHHYGYHIDFSRPLFYDIPNENGILKHYRVSHNADFVDIVPGEGAKEISEQDVDLLIQNIEDVEIWKQMFPPRSWIFKGFTIINLTDVTADDAISELKTTLLHKETSTLEELQKFQEIFQAIFKISDLRVGITFFNKQEMVFERMDNRDAYSFILNKESMNDGRAAICEASFNKLTIEQEYFSITNIDEYEKKSNYNLLSQNLKNSHVKSCILAPISKDNELLAVLELVSPRKNELNSINAIKLDDILPYIVTAVKRNKTESENRIKAVIQSECTSIHPSVLWIFEKEAKSFIKEIDGDGLASFKDIAFKDVYPLYGQIDIVGSSDERNSAILYDLIEHLELIEKIIEEAFQQEELPIYDQIRVKIRDFKEEVNKGLTTDSEQQMLTLLEREIDPLMDDLSKKSEELMTLAEKYQANLNPDTGMIYNHRKQYDDTVQIINRTMARVLDKKQRAAQKIYPHYFERYKTDGVDHNIYIGEDLTYNRPFNMDYLYNLRLWQLVTMCEMENRFCQLQKTTPIKLDASSLILVFNATLSIRYRMDEKKFDVDGTYNARYEIIKKRIDKAFIKDTEERITQKGKLAIIYSHNSDEEEYLKYVKYLQTRNYLGDQVELLELEDVQGVIGLRALRVNIIYKNNESASGNTITSKDMVAYLSK
jgi:hypothetical protein